MATVKIKAPKKRKFAFEIEGEGKFSVPAFANLPMDVAMKLEGKSNEEVMTIYMAYLVEQCPSLSKIDIETMGLVIAEWMKDSGVTAGE